MMPAIESVEGLRKAAEAAPMVVDPVAAADMAARFAWASDRIEQLQTVLATVAIFIEGEPIANAVVVPEGQPVHGRHPSLLDTINAALGHQQPMTGEQSAIAAHEYLHGKTKKLGQP